MGKLDSSAESAARVMRGLLGWAEAAGELVEVSAKSPAGRWRTVQRRAAELWDPVTCKEIAAWSARGREVYFGCVGLTGTPDRSWQRGNAALRGHAGALWLDVDCQAPDRTGQEYFDGVEEAVAAVDTALGPVLRGAALVLGSGWGVQYWVPLAEPVPGRVASQAVRCLVGVVAELTGKKVDRVWDVTRVMRMPGTWNFRAGPDPDEARPTGVIRWPGRVADARLELGFVIDVLSRQVDVESSSPLGLGGLLERYGGVSTGEPAGAGGDGGGGWVGDVPLDLERLADEVLAWADVLEPGGWRCVTGEDGRGREQVWERPGKHGAVGDWGGERSAVVYADKPELLVVYSDSPSTGFSAGLRGSGARGEGAGVGVMSKWRAWVDLAWAGDEREAAERVRARWGRGDGGGEDGDGVAERLAEAWTGEMTWVAEWAQALTEQTWERASGMMPPGVV